MTSSACTLAALLLSSTAITFFIPLCTSEEIAQENLKKLVIANNELSLNLLRQLTANKTENVFFSPFSLSTAFGMLYYGTKGDTAKELRTALGYDAADLKEESIHQTFQQYLTQWLPSQDNSSYDLTSANAALLDKKFNLVPSYKKEVQDLYQASVQDVDFEGEAPQVIEEINSWASEKTNGKIESLVDDLDPSTAFILLNVVYFKGAWNTEFDVSRTSPETFYNYGLETGAKEANMMGRRRYNFPYFEREDFKALELVYKGKNVSMMILLPKKRDGLESMEKNLTLETLSEVRRQMYTTSVSLAIPKFKIEYSKEMSEDFKSIGAKRVFTTAADFSGIASGQDVYLEEVLHKAVVEVNEEGSEATAATKFVSRLRSGSLTSFVAEHPFFFAIVDKRNDMILFLGHVTNL